jgi:hypothetical protein
VPRLRSLTPSAAEWLQLGRLPAGLRPLVPLLVRDPDAPIDISGSWSVVEPRVSYPIIGNVATHLGTTVGVKPFPLSFAKAEETSGDGFTVRLRSSLSPPRFELRRRAGAVGRAPFRSTGSQVAATFIRQKQRHHRSM